MHFLIFRLWDKLLILIMALDVLYDVGAFVGNLLLDYLAYIIIDQVAQKALISIR